MAVPEIDSQLMLVRYRLPAAGGMESSSKACAGRSVTGRVRGLGAASSKHSVCRLRRTASAAIAPVWTKRSRASARGDLSSTSRTAARGAVLSTPLRPECVRDREVRVWPRPTGRCRA